MNLRRLTGYTVMLGAAAWLAGGCVSVSPTATERATTLRETMASVAQWEYGQDRAPLVAAEQVLNACRTAAGRSAAEAALLALARDPSASRGARQFALQQLGRFGSPGSVEPLLQLLADPAVGPDAAATLERMRTPGVDDRLRSALPHLPAAGQAHVLRILGTHAEAQSVSAIEPFLRSQDTELAALAVRALGRIATPAAADLLIRYIEVAARVAQDGGWDACLACLDTAIARADRGTAERCLVALDGARAPDHVRAAAALATAAATSANERLYRALTMLGSTNGAMQAAGVEILKRYSDDAALARAANALGILPAASQVAVLGLLEDRGAPGADRLIQPLLASSEPAVRTAALRALGGAGSAESVAVLAKAAAESPEEERAVARRALRRINGPGVDQRFEELLRTTDGDVRLELLRAVGDRGVPTLAPVVFELTASSDDALRREAIKQAGALAGAAQWSRLLDGLMSSTHEADTAAWVTAAEAAALRLSRSASDLAARWTAAKSPTSRIALLSLVGRLRPPELLPAVAEAAGSEDAAIRNAAIRALSAWADPSALAPLMAAARHADAATRRLAQRGLVQVLRQATGLDTSERTARAADIAPMLEHADEQRALLAILAESGPAGAEVAARFLDQPAVRAEAELAVLRAARAAGARPAPSVRAALERIAKDSEAADRREEAAKLLAPPL